ncbi:1714_t:CDS:2, partial [Gigaspora rosea]
ADQTIALHVQNCPNKEGPVAFESSVLSIVLKVSSSVIGLQTLLYMSSDIKLIGNFVSPMLEVQSCRLLDFLWIHNNIVV